jgi:hypothetical protein
MNPEFQRNVWVELTPRRLTLMVVLLALVFFAAAVSGDRERGPAHAAELLYYAIVVIWGTRNAATAVVGEIRDRTWDMQVLSSITPGAMMWGKLFGSTIYNWFGGAICLAVMLSDTAVHKGAPTAAIDLVYYLAIGVISQAAAFLASLIAVRRRQAHTRLDIFVYQVVGLIAGAAVYAVWSIADPAESILTHLPPSDFISWWGRSFDTRGFLLASLAVFTAWTLVGCYREMRLELQMRNGTLVWLGFLAFIGLYVAGFDAKLVNNQVAAGWTASSLRFGAAGVAYAVLTYIMVVLEPKDRVHYRWLGGQLSAGRFGAFWNGLQAWMMAYAATLFCGAALILSIRQAAPELLQPQIHIVTALGFLTRDVFIFVLMRNLPGKRRGDFAALGILLALYVLAPAIANGLELKGLLMAFYPQPTTPAWLGPLVAWAEGIALAVLALSRASIRNSPADRSEPSPVS